MFRTGAHATTRTTTRQAPPITPAMPTPQTPATPSAVQRLRARRGNASDDAGFTMIEAIVSFVIFAIVIAAAVLAIVGGISTSNSNRDRVTAANVAQQALAQAQALPTASLTAAPTAQTTNTVGSEPYTVVRKIDYAQATGTATATSSASACPTAISSGTAYWMHIAVTVTWPGANGRSVQMDTVRSC